MKYKNNPFALKHFPFFDIIGEDEPLDGYCQFCTLEYGVRAYLVRFASLTERIKFDSVEDFLDVYFYNEIGKARAVLNALAPHYQNLHKLKPSAPSVRYELAYQIAYVETRTCLDIDFIRFVAEDYHLFDFE